jgi:uncharacterized protein
MTPEHDVPGTEGSDDAGPEPPVETGEDSAGEKSVTVVGVYEHPQGGAFVLLRDEGERNLPIWIGQAEALSIALALEGGSTPRPMTHDLLKLMVEQLGGAVERAVINDLKENVYYARTTLRQGGESIEIDCRPSDVIAVALRFNAPISVAEHVMAQGHMELTAEGPDPEERQKRERDRILSWEEVVEKFRKRIYRFIISPIVANPEVAETLTEETFRIASERFGSGRSEHRLHTWLHRIALTQCYEWLQQHEPDEVEEAPSEEGGGEPVMDEDRDLTFEEIVGKYEKKIFNLILRQIGDRDAAEDLTQGTFLRAYREFPTFEGRCTVHTWLCWIASIQCKDWLASRVSGETTEEG